ncbi:DUF6065 family protein [Novosphingobium sp. Fuku2-ISO-50]|uniref:DUF6065 family protein n=1 Tax=Novosphingobium sp. Fuku2-ISO-50 TaxID=1739114 RepID=UPI000A5BA3E5|nr:DUF6065 family protein [Novosphingobium sp. Fuku2-ISO-50]
MDLKCFVFPGWEPRIVPASSKRGWMDAAPEAFPYRCLPLGIANSYGWDILSPCGFEAEWNGGIAPEDVVVRPDPGARDHEVPVALFGLGTFTIHIQGLFRTPPGWNMLVSGPPNSPKDGIAPLSGIIETDWSPYTFTMNWKLTRPGHVVRFEENEVIAHIFPIERKVIETITPRVLSINEDPDLKASFEAWSRSRDAFQQHVRETAPEKPSDKWQKLYYRGLPPEGGCPFAEHQSKLRLHEFADAIPVEPARPAEPVPVAPPERSEADWKIAKYEWLFETMERQRALSSAASDIFRVSGITGDEFLDNFYAPGRPVILCDAIADWPALHTWTPRYLRERIGSAVISYQGARQGNARFELDKDAHGRDMPFDAFIDLITSSAGNDTYLTAYNAARNALALAPLAPDLGALEGILDHRAGENPGLIWIGPEGTFTPLHHDLTNNLLVQIAGRKRVILASPAETPKLYNHLHVFSEISDLTDPDLDLSAHPRLKDVRLLEVVIEPGEALFLPIGWWHQVTALDFSISLTHTNFVWPNKGYAEHPAR